MKDYLSKLAKGLTPYVPGEQPKVKLTKLNTNENPYPPSKKAIMAMTNAVQEVRLYSPPECEELRQAIADVEGLPDIDYVYAFNGSDEALACCFGAFFDPEHEIAFPDITYSFYPVYCNLFSLNYKTVPLTDDFSLDIDGMVSDGGIIFPNPNAPTAKAITLPEIERILNVNKDKVVIVDEAYEAFCDCAATSLIPKYDNLIIARTLSKSHSFAGGRVGFCMAQPHLIEGLIRVKNSFNSYTLDVINQKGATESILDVEYKNSMCNKVKATRNSFINELRKLNFTVSDSDANFVFAKHNTIKGIEIFEKLKNRGILVRRFDTPQRISDYLRITIGTDKEMGKVISELKSFCL